jgi:hypothetical protein
MLYQLSYSRVPRMVAQGWGGRAGAGGGVGV